MTKVELHLLACCCSALLPHRTEESDVNDENYNYYQLLGVNKDATSEDIRKAYKKCSLRFHPDKIAQRRSAGVNEEVSRQEFQRIKEAYETLINPRKRDIYDVMGPNAMPYLMNPSLIEPQTVFDNLAKATTVDRIKVVLIACILWCILFIQPILICHKVESSTSISWIIFLIPIWFLDTVCFLVLTGLYFASKKLRRKEKEDQAPAQSHAQSKISSMKVLSVLPFIKLSCVITTQILLALKFDGTLSSPYLILFVPLYFYEFIRMTQAVYIISTEKANMARMVTITFVEEETGKNYTDFTAEERDAINEKYIIVHSPPTPPDIDEKLKSVVDELDIIQSPDFQLSAKRQNESYDEIFSVILHTIFLGFLIPNLDLNAVNWSWWLVFIPVWLRFIFVCAKSCFMLCCTGPAPLQPDDEEDHISDDEQDVSNISEDEANTIEHQEIDSVPNVSEHGPEKTSEVNLEEDSEGKDKTEGDTFIAPKLTVRTVSIEIERNDSNVESSLDDKLIGDIESNIEIDQMDGAYDAFEGFEEDSSSIEDTGKALAACCSVLFYVIIVCLFVGKLEGDSYSSYWVIFPVLLPAGMILCSLSCGIMLFRGHDFQQKDGEEDSERVEPPEDEVIRLGNKDDEKGSKVADNIETVNVVVNPEPSQETTDFGDLD